MDSTVLSLIAICLSFIIFFFCCMKGLGPVITSFICAALVGLTTQSGLNTAFFSTYVSGALTFGQNVFIPMIIGAAMGGIYSATGSTEVIGKQFVKWLGPNNAVFIIMGISFLMPYLGVSAYVFVCAYVAFGVLKAANLPRTVGVAAMGGSASIAMLVAPGGANIANLVPTFTLGTDLYAAPLMGWVCTFIGIGLDIFYVQMLARTARKNKIGYTEPEYMLGKEMIKEDNLPSFGIAITPLIAILVLLYIFQKIFLMSADNALVLAQVIGIILMFVFNWNRIIGDKLKMIADSASNGFGVFMACVAVTGFGSVVQDTSGYQFLIEKLLGLNVNPYVQIFIVVAVVCAMCADGLGGMSVFFSTLAPSFLEQGLDPAAMHRVTTCTATTFDSLPHNSVVNINLQVFGLTHKEGYKHLAVVQIGIPIIYSIVAVIMAILFY